MMARALYFRPQFYLWALTVCAGAFIGLTTWRPAAADALIIEETTVPAKIRGWTYALEALVVKPADSVGRLPIALITHGSPRTIADRPKMRARAMMAPQARDLAYRGWLVVAFMRRGFGASDGPFAEFGGGCDSASVPNYYRALTTAAEDISAVHAAVSQRADADPSRVLGMGTSVGGAAMVAWAAMQPNGLVAIINLSGGTGSPAAGRNCDESGLVSAFTTFGNTARAPALWLYAENDSYFWPDFVRRFHAGFLKQGGKAELEMFRPIGKDGHDLTGLSEGRRLWLPALDRFLRQHDLPTWNRAPIDALAEGLNSDARGTLARYLGAPTEKALSISREKRLARWWSASNDIQEARQKSHELCERELGEPCDVLLENFTPIATKKHDVKAGAPQR